MPSGVIFWAICILKTQFGLSPKQKINKREPPMKPKQKCVPIRKRVAGSVNEEELEEISSCKVLLVAVDKNLLFSSFSPLYIFETG